MKKIFGLLLITFGLLLFVQQAYPDFYGLIIPYFWYVVIMLWSIANMIALKRVTILLFLFFLIGLFGLLDNLDIIQLQPLTPWILPAVLVFFGLRILFKKSSTRIEINEFEAVFKDRNRTF